MFFRRVCFTSRPSFGTRSTSAVALTPTTCWPPPTPSTKPTRWSTGMRPSESSRNRCTGNGQNFYVSGRSRIRLLWTQGVGRPSKLKFNCLIFWCPSGFIHTAAATATATERTKKLKFFRCHCRHNGNTTTCCHDTHFFYCHCRHDWVLNPLVTSTAMTLKNTVVITVWTSLDNYFHLKIFFGQIVLF